MQQFTRFLFLAALAMPLTSWATEVPRPGQYDARIKHVVYNAYDVVKIVGHYGYSTHIQFAEGETIKNVALGDSLAWEVAPVGNHLFSKPREPKATTNMTVLTTKRVYNFVLTAKKNKNPNSRDLYFQVAFSYPAEEAAARRAAEKAEQARQIALDTKKLLGVATRDPVNWDYVGCGAQSVMPNLVWDDRTYTYMQFANNRNMPAVFVVDGSDGEDGEALVNTHVEGGVIVIHRTAPQFVLRRGQSVACVVNRHYDPNGVANTTDTFSKNVKRVLKTGDEQ